MFPNPFGPPPPPPGTRIPPGITGGEKGRMVILGVAMLLVLGVMGALLVYVQSAFEVPAAKEEGPHPQDMPPEKPAPGEGPEITFAPSPLFPEEEKEEVERILGEDLAKWTDVVDGVPAVDPGPFNLLLDRVSSHARIMNLQEESFDGGLEPSALLAAPAGNRGRLVLVSGELLSLAREPWTIESGLVQEVRRGLLRDGAGRLWTFTWAVGNPLEPDPVAPGEGWVRVQGIFYKSWPAKDPASGAEVPTPHLVLQRRPRKDFPKTSVHDLDAAWFGQVRDGTPAEMTVRDEDPLFWLLNLSGNIGQQGWEKWASEKQARDPGLRIWPPENLTGRYKELLDNPAPYRFRPIRYFGYLALPSVIREVRPNPANVEQLWIGFLVDDDGAPAIWVYSPRSLLENGIRKDDRVMVDGFFLKRVAYEPAGGGAMKRAAVMVATRILPAPLPTDNVGRSVMVAIAAFMGLLTLGLLFTVLRGRREAEEAEQRRLDRIAKRRQERGTPVIVVPGRTGPPGVPPEGGA